MLAQRQQFNNNLKFIWESSVIIYMQFLQIPVFPAHNKQNDSRKNPKPACELE